MRRDARWRASFGMLACIAGAMLTCASATAQQAERNQPPLPEERRSAQDPDQDPLAQPERRSVEPREARPGSEGRREDRAARRDDRRAPRRSAEEGRRQEEAWLGVYLSESDEQAEGQEGVRVTHVYPTSPAARAGFRRGDTIMQINGQPVQGPDSVISLVEEQEPGSEAKFVVRRGDQDIELTAKLGSRSAFGLSGEDRRSFSEGESSEDDPYGRVPPYVMQLEHDRRMAEQHQRIEEALRQLQEEVRMLKEEIQKGRN